MQTQIKHYWRIRYSLIIFKTFFLIFLIFIFLKSGISERIYLNVLNFSSSRIALIAIYLAIIYFLYSIIFFPLDLYFSFILERRFLLSSQKFFDWFVDKIKSDILFYFFSLIFVEFFYFFLRLSPQNWWMLICGFWIFFALLISKIAPVFLVPLFFKYKKLSDEELRKCIFLLAERMKIKILDVYEIDFSRKTNKANAAFLGIGKTKRIVLSDTLRGKYNLEEIKVILAHEFSHYRLGHLFKLLGMEALFIIFSFYLIFISCGYFLKKFGFTSLEEIASLPLVFLYLIVLEIFFTPLKNFVSRFFERQADRLAIEIIQAKGPFISLMEKLAKQNFTDTSPHPLIKFFFFDHPPIEERIRRAKDYI